VHFASSEAESISPWRKDSSPSGRELIHLATLLLAGIGKDLFAHLHSLFDEQVLQIDDLVPQLVAG
jgi:hypothetical protein